MKPPRNGARASWWSRNRPPAWVFVAVAAWILLVELPLLHWIEVVW